MTGTAERRLDKQATVGTAFLWWAGRTCSICEPEKFPDGPADTFTLLVDFLKQDPSGKGMPRAVRAQHSSPVKFSCVSAIEAYARSRRLRPTEPLLMMGERQLKWDTLRLLMCLLAKWVGIDSDRLLIHSFRYSTPNQIIAAGFARDVVMIQGGWATEGGAAAYLMSTLNHAAMVANAIHDAKAIPVDYLVHAFTSGKHVGGNGQS